MHRFAAGLLLAVLLGTACRPDAPQYEPESIHLGHDGVLYLHDREGARIHRYSLADREHLAPLVLGAGSEHAAYSPAHHALYVAYAAGTITVIDLSAEPAEAPFADLDEEPFGLAAAGPFLFAAATYHQRTFGADGTLVSEIFTQPYHVSEDYVWSPADARIYHTDGPDYTQDVYRRPIDPTTGELAHGDEWDREVPVAPPLRVSRDGEEVLLGGGQIFGALGLEVRGVLPVDPLDGLWLEDGALLTLTEAADGRTQLDHWRADRSLFNRQLFFGRPLRVLEHGDAFVVVTQGPKRPRFHTYVPTDDPDGDGVANPLDRFPLDPAASVDSDGDGLPDAWNPGAGPEDSTEALALDAFPGDSACATAAQGAGGVCDVDAAIPPFDPAETLVGIDDVAYLLSPEHARIHRWSLSERRYLNPLVTADDPVHMAYSPSLHRLYVAYEVGTITRIELFDPSPREQEFAVAYGPVRGLAVAGAYLFVPVHFADAVYQTFRPDGALAGWSDLSFGFSSHWTWSGSDSRLYGFTPYSSSELCFEGVDAATGEITSRGSADRGEPDVRGPIRVKPDGSRIVLGTGDVYEAPSLELRDSLPVDPTDAAWLGDDLVTLRPAGDGATQVEQWRSHLTPWNGVRYAGAPLRVLTWSGGVEILTSVAGRPTFRPYVPTDDGDGDGVPNDADAFPQDPAASADTDHDGYPDAWNPGAGPGDSTTGLQLDAFPSDSACWLPAHGAGGVCDVGATILPYTPGRVNVHGDVVYLLSPAERRVHRWSAALGRSLNPIVLGGTPRDMAHSPERERLYLGYEDGRITFVDLTDVPVERPFAVLHEGVRHLANAGGLLFAADQGEWTYTFDAAGTRLARDRSFLGAEPFPGFEWSASQERFYYVGHDDRAELWWQPIDPTTGEILQYRWLHSYDHDPNLLPPVRLSSDETRFLLGTGQLWNTDPLEWTGSLPHPIHDAIWTSDRLATVWDPGDGSALVEQWSPDARIRWGEASFPGTPIRLLPGPSGLIVVTEIGGKPAFHRWAPPEDTDGDGVDNPADGFPLDPAASLDADADGFPDAWNPGVGPDDSPAGLELDAFPADFACQLAAHGQGGLCDFRRIVPPDPGAPLCSSDELGGGAESGVLAIPGAVDLVPLCDGWVAYGDEWGRRVVIQDVFTGRLGLVARLPGVPRDLALDPDGKRIFAAAGDARAAVEIDLVSGATRTFDFPHPVRAVHRGAGSELLVAIRPYASDTSRDLYRLDLETGTSEGPVFVSHAEMRYHPGRVERISRHGRTLARTFLDFQAQRYLLVEKTEWGFQSTSLAVSPDLGHVAFGTIPWNGGSLAHFASDDLGTVLGVWSGVGRPSDVEFDPTSSRVAASTTDSLQILDVPTHSLLVASVDV